MHFDSFSIRKIADNSIANMDEVDRMVCEEFNFEFNEEDYGHFYFTDAKEELGSFQKSISWAGLIHTIVYYSNIGYGYRDVFEILGALYETMYGPGSRGILIKWPYSTFGFTAELLQFLKMKGLYVYVDYNDSPDNLYENLPHTNSVYIFESESGRFECNLDGQLTVFFPNTNNLVDPLDIEDINIFNYYNPCIRSLVIPEGVTNLSKDFFRGGYVQKSVILPKSLKSLGSIDNTGVFSLASLPDLVIPETITAIGPYAFAESKIKSLYIPKMFKYEDTCQFKDAAIEKLIMPRRSLREKIVDKRKDPYNYFYYNFSKICRVGVVEYV